MNNFLDHHCQYDSATSQNVDYTDVSFIAEQGVASSNIQDFCHDHKSSVFQKNYDILNSKSDHLVSASSVTDKHLLVSKVKNIVQKKMLASVSSIDELKICHLNVSGLQTKLENGILDQFLSSYDLIFLVETNTESPILKDTILENYKFLVKRKINSNHKFKYGGVHGMIVLIKENLSSAVEEIELSAECALWIRVKINGIFHGIFGSIYVPCESSRFYYNEIFEEIENDILEIRSRLNLPICLLGDFNAHTNTQIDILQTDVSTANMTGCNILQETQVLEAINVNRNLTCTRYNQDSMALNKNGKRLISLCKSLDFFILNGRLGNDKFIGRQTCH